MIDDTCKEILSLDAKRWGLEFETTAEIPLLLRFQYYLANAIIGGFKLLHPNFHFSKTYKIVGDCIYSSKRFRPDLDQSKCCLDPV